jgi:phage tail sheath gpL-like
MYQTNSLGADDIAYLDANTLFTIMYLRYDFRTQILSRYPRAKLANDGVQIGPGQQVMTPKLGKSEAINIFRGWETLGLVEGIDTFKRDLICVRSTTDPNRLEWILPPDLVNQFRVGAATIQFLLESSY